MTAGWAAVAANIAGLHYEPAGYFYAVDGTAYPGAPAPPDPPTNDRMVALLEDIPMMPPRVKEIIDGVRWLVITAEVTE